eukprot:4717789-Pyramimonas_sp.AAC.1
MGNLCTPLVRGVLDQPQSLEAHNVSCVAGHSWHVKYHHEFSPGRMRVAAAIPTADMTSHFLRFPSHQMHTQVF